MLGWLSLAIARASACQALMGGQGSLGQQLDRYCPAELFVSGPTRR
ncbi:MAG: hypothetical protein KatS3mg061_2073 [Dehalococcoidia bacterium]|nr:MAG: hypothetical protein KatS3mg061_2073 [Dehalococcoidia bacterium]